MNDESFLNIFTWTSSLIHIDLNFELYIINMIFYMTLKLSRFLYIKVRGVMNLYSNEA